MQFRISSLGKNVNKQHIAILFSKKKKMPTVSNKCPPGQYFGASSLDLTAS